MWGFLRGGWRLDWKLWSCKGGHVLGQVVRDGNGVRHLLLYRNAIDLHPRKGGGEGV